MSSGIKLVGDINLLITHFIDIDREGNGIFFCKRYKQYQSPGIEVSNKNKKRRRKPSLNILIFNFQVKLMLLS
jgi:hypothetical protein